jgi:hypothetical protein
MHFTKEFVEKLEDLVPDHVKEFWDIYVFNIGVIRVVQPLHDPFGSIRAIYLSIRTKVNNNTPEWLKFYHEKGEYQLDSIYTSMDLYEVGDHVEYRYTCDEKRELIAVYDGYHELKKLAFDPSVTDLTGKIIGTQLKNGEISHYISKGKVFPPAIIQQFSGVEGEDEALHCWTDNEDHVHWHISPIPLSAGGAT